MKHISGVCDHVDKQVFYEAFYHDFAVKAGRYSYFRFRAGFRIPILVVIRSGYFQLK